MKSTTEFKTEVIEVKQVTLVMSADEFKRIREACYVRWIRSSEKEAKATKANRKALYDTLDALEI